MAQDNRKKMKDLIAAVESQGWEVKLRKGHYRVTASSGQKMFFPSTPSDIRGINNARSVLRRHGAQV